MYSNLNSIRLVKSFAYLNSTTKNMFTYIFLVSNSQSLCFVKYCCVMEQCRI